jgi:hypothetical protein
MQSDLTATMPDLQQNVLVDLFTLQWLCFPGYFGRNGKAIMRIEEMENFMKWQVCKVQTAIFFNQTKMYDIRAARFHMYWNYMIVEPQYLKKRNFPALVRAWHGIYVPLKPQLDLLCHFWSQEVPAIGPKDFESRKNCYFGAKRFLSNLNAWKMVVLEPGDLRFFQK